MKLVLFGAAGVGSLVAAAVGTVLLIVPPSAAFLSECEDAIRGGLPDPSVYDRIDVRGPAFDPFDPEWFLRAHRHPDQLDVSAFRAQDEIEDLASTFDVQERVVAVLRIVFRADVAGSPPQSVTCKAVLPFAELPRDRDAYEHLFIEDIDAALWRNIP